MIKEARLIAPAIPARFGLSGEKLKVGATHEPLDPLSHLIRLATVFAPGLDDKLSHIPTPSLRLAASRKQALFGIGSGPISEAGEEARALAVLLDPIETNGLVLETPCANELEGLIQERVNGPQEQRTIIGREVSNRERGEFLVGQAVIVRDRVPASPFDAPVSE